MKHCSAAIDEVLAELGKPPLVTIEDGVVTLFDRDHPGFRYDFILGDAVDALEWIRHVSGKTWITKRHIEALAALALRELGAKGA